MIYYAEYCDDDGKLIASFPAAGMTEEELIHFAQAGLVRLADTGAKSARILDPNGREIWSGKTGA